MHRQMEVGIVVVDGTQEFIKNHRGDNLDSFLQKWLQRMMFYFGGCGHLNSNSAQNYYKILKYAIFMQKFLHNSKKSSTFVH